MGILKTTKKLVENKLKTLSPLPSIAWENVSFVPPANGDLYLRCNLQIGRPDDSCIGGNYYRENITFNIYIMDKLNIGTGNALDKAEAIRDLFQKRTTLSEGATRIQVLNTPRIAGAVVTNERLVVPISIELVVENLA